MEGALEEEVEDSQLLWRVWCATMADVHLTEQLHGDGPAREVLLAQSARLEDPGQEEQERREIGRERGRGLVVSGDTQVGIQLRQTD